MRTPINFFFFFFIINHQKNFANGQVIVDTSSSPSPSGVQSIGHRSKFFNTPTVHLVPSSSSSPSTLSGHKEVPTLPILSRESGHRQQQVSTSASRNMISTETVNNNKNNAQVSKMATGPTMDETMAEIMRFAAEKLSKTNFDHQHNHEKDGNNDNNYQVLNQMLMRMDKMERKIDDLLSVNTERVTKLETEMIEEQFSSKIFMKTMNEMKTELGTKFTDFESKLNFAVDFITRNAMSVDSLLRRTIEVSNSNHENSDSSSFVSSKLNLIETQVADLVNKMDIRESNLVNRMGNIERLTSNTYNCLISLSNDVNNINRTVNDLKQQQQSINRVHGQQPLAIVHHGKDGNSQGTSTRGGNLTTNLLNLTSLNIVNIPQIEDMKQTLIDTRSKMEEMDMDIEVYTRKVINSINVLSKSSFEIETLVNESKRMSNLSLERWERLSKDNNYQFDKQTKITTDIQNGLKKMEQNVNEVLIKIINSHEAIMMAQNGFIDNCYRIQSEETQVYDMIDFRLIEMNQTIYKSSLKNDEIKDLEVKIDSKFETKLNDIQALLEKLIKRLKASKELNNSMSPVDGPMVPSSSTTQGSTGGHSLETSTSKPSPVQEPVVGPVGVRGKEKVVKALPEVAKDLEIEDGHDDEDDDDHVLDDDFVKKTLERDDPTWKLRNKMID